ncbi:MAG: hypothetical protein V1747_04025 [Candidatus Omnitrophota bacterium]
MIETVALIIVGWLLGLLAPTIVDSIRKDYQKKNIQTSINSELKDIQYRLGCFVFLINRRFGIFDRQLLIWISKIFNTYRGAYYDKKLLEALESQLRLSDEELSNIGIIIRPAGSEFLPLSKSTTYFLDSHIGNLLMFSPNYQSKIIEIKTQLDLLNDLVENSRLYFRMTFDQSIGTDNQNIVRKNLERCYASIADKAKTIADSIDNCIK